MHRSNNSSTLKPVVWPKRLSDFTIRIFRLVLELSSAWGVRNVSCVNPLPKGNGTTERSLHELPSRVVPISIFKRDVLLTCTVIGAGHERR